MKKSMALFMTAFMSVCAAASAANPFSDVSVHDWAYQAVSDLSDQGVIEGYPNGTFRGERNVTRFEMAQIVARLMAKEDSLAVDQRNSLAKLQREYADELSSLGVRVSKLEKQVGNISWSGDARARYLNKSLGNADTWDGRIRLFVKADINPSTHVRGRFNSTFNYKTNSPNGNTSMDMLYVDHKIGSAEIKLGRYVYKLGNQGGWIYGGAPDFDGAEASFKVGNNIWLKTGYGQFNQGDTLTKDHFDFIDKDFFYAGADWKYMPKGLLQLGYLRKVSRTNDNDKNYEVLDANIMIPAGDFRIYGDYAKNTVGDKGTGWNAGLGYGSMNLKKSGTWQLEAYYNDVDRGIYHGGNPIQNNMFDATRDNTWKANGLAGKGENIKFWNVMGDVAVMKNIFIHGEYAFGARADKGEDPADSWTLSLNYNF